MKLALLLGAVSLYATAPLLELHVVGPVEQTDATYMLQLKSALNTTSLGSWGVDIERNDERCDERFCITLFGDATDRESTIGDFFRALKTCEEGDGELGSWLSRLMSTSVLSAQHFLEERATWEEVRGGTRSLLSEEEIAKRLEQIGHAEPDLALYNELYSSSLTQADTDHIDFIVRALATDSILTLAFKRAELDRRGAEIDHIHPLVFLGYIAAHPELQPLFHKVAERSLTWGPWVAGFSDKMRLCRDEVAGYLPGFCHHLGANPLTVHALLEREDYEGLLRLFF